MKSLPKFDLRVKTQLLVTFYVTLTNHTLHVTRVAICHNLHAITSLHRGLNDRISKSHHVSFSPEVDVKMPKLSEAQRHILLDAEPGWRCPTNEGGCCTATINRIRVCYNSTGSTRDRLSQAKIDTSGWCTFEINVGQQHPQLAIFMD